MRSQRALAGIAVAVTACACFSALDTTTKYVSAFVPLLMALWFRYAFQAVATTWIVLPLRGMAVLRTRNPMFQLLRGVLLLTSSLLAFASLKYMPVGEFTAIVMMAPLAITVLAATVLKEDVSPLRWGLVAGGFAGTLVIIRPGGEA
ncbi:MAG TPA: EamA family transporter, partial [Ramlibacter sp.]|nr:EamA family transporter [Ramlibacter sp.]